MQILMQIENAVCVFYLINTPFAAHYPHPVFCTMAVECSGELHYNAMKNHHNISI